MLRQSFAFNILLAHIPVKETSAADFLPRMHTEPNLTLEIEFKDHVANRETKTDTEEKAADLTLSKISDIRPLLKQSNLAVTNNSSVN